MNNKQLYYLKNRKYILRRSELKRMGYGERYMNRILQREFPERYPTTEEKKEYNRLWNIYYQRGYRKEEIDEQIKLHEKKLKLQKQKLKKSLYNKKYRQQHPYVPTEKDKERNKQYKAAHREQINKRANQRRFEIILKQKKKWNPFDEGTWNHQLMESLLHDDLQPWQYTIKLNQIKINLKYKTQF